MNLEYPENNKNTPSDSDEFDEFGGGFLTVEKIYGKTFKSNACNIIPDTVDEDDEFGGGSLNLEKIYGKKSTTTDTAPTSTPATKTEDEPLFTCKYNIFSPIIPTNQWYVSRDTLENSVIDPTHSVTIPLVIDTEFTNQDSKKDYRQKSRIGLTTQICGIGSDTPKSIYVHTERVNAGRMLAEIELLPKIDSNFHPVDYLRTLGLEVDIWEATESKLAAVPKCFIVLYGHFLTAELNMIASGTVKERILALQQSEGEEQIASGRRAYCQSVAGEQKLDWVSLKHLISLDGWNYELCLKLVDTGAIHGVASYKNFANASGWELQYKDTFNSDEKAKMLDMAIERYKDFENYALGDLEVYEALNSYYEQWQLVYEKLGLADYFQCPKLTIGGTVKDLFEGALAAKLEVEPNDEDGKSIWKKTLSEIIEQFIKPASASELRQYSTFTRALLSKVEGGRCRNNRPIDVFARRKIKGKYDAGLICDIDISGCYGEGQRNQSYFLGIPEIFDYKASKNNTYISLRDWLKAYGVEVETLIKAVNEKDKSSWQNADNWGELLAGAWYARISTKEKLKYPQDYFASWFTDTVDRVDLLAKAIRNMKSDSEMQATDWANFDEDCGSLKIFNNEIHNGVLSHDGLQWIFAICSPRQRNELLDTIQILASSVYPRSQRMNGSNPKEALANLKTTYDNWEGKNKTERVTVNGRSQIVMNFDECHKWFDINMGTLITDDLLIERKKAQKVYGKKSPLDQLFKLCVNTLYGDMVSKYFITSNPVVGNNITARARCLAWYMEKGLHGWQSVTDGCAFELNGVMFPLRDNINGETINQHRKNSKLKQRMIKRSPLGEVKEILGVWNDITYTKWDDGIIETVTEKFLTLNIDGLELIPTVKPDKEHEGCEIIDVPAMRWIDKQAMNHLQNLFPLVDVLHNESSTIKINDDLSTSYITRVGQFDFETKDVYHSGAFHGSANYILVNPQITNIKARGYETGRNHDGIDGLVSEGDEITFLQSDRYGVKKNPAKDFMGQLLDNPESITRQLPAIKSGILKISDYKNLSAKYDELGIVPGDGILRTFLMQEYSNSQFTFQTYEQYMNWKTIITHLKDTDRQSLEGYFLNQDGKVDFVRLSNWVDEQIAAGVDKPFDLLVDPNRHDRRAEERAKNPVTSGQGKGKKQKMVSLSHPNLDTFNALRKRLNDTGFAEVSTDD